MESMNAWAALFFLVWLLCMFSLFLYMNYRGSFESSIFASVSKSRLYLMLRFFRSLTFLVVSCSVIAFLYYETNVFIKKIPEFRITLTRDQYQMYLKDRSRLLNEKTKFVGKEQVEILERQKSFFDEKLADIDKAYEAHITALAGHMGSLRKLYPQSSWHLLNKAREAMAAGNLMDADIFLEAIENGARLDANGAGRLGWARGFLAKQSGDFGSAYKHFSRSERFIPEDPELDIQAAWTALHAGDYKASKFHYQAALSECIRLYGENDPQVAEAYRDLGSLAAETGNYREAHAYYEKALYIDLQAYKENHPDIARDRYNVGWALKQLQKYRNSAP